MTDMVRYTEFGEGSQWTSEYGDPADPAEFDALLRYSPYHGVRDGVRYPATLVTTTEKDSVVDAMHARKFVAALQHASTGGPVLLSVKNRGNHSRSDRQSARIEAEADVFAFVLSRLDPF